jgi:drug/metabolite transporter (DMT)-like permease
MITKFQVAYKNLLRKKVRSLLTVVGIALSDTFFFQCLNLLGASLTAVVDCLYSPFVILFSFLFLGERLSFRQILGGLIPSASCWFPFAEKGSSRNCSSGSSGLWP